MKWYSIFFSENGKHNWMPVYEGKDGRYWLGGTASLMFPLIFSSRRKGEEALKRILLVELEQATEPRGVFQRGKFAVKRCDIIDI